LVRVLGDLGAGFEVRHVGVVLAEFVDWVAFVFVFLDAVIFGVWV
jgi:hypothetical protein